MSEPTADREQLFAGQFDSWSPYPWHEQPLLRWFDAQRRDRLPHALLVKGPEHTGKRVLARLLASYLLCESPADERSCGACRACTMARAGTHPDWLELRPEQPGKVIRVDSIRRMQSRLHQTAQFGGAKLCILYPAEALNENAANALLKILEEPPEQTYFILVSHRPQLLSATIRSRCGQLALSLPASESVRQWLAGEYAEDDIAQALALCRGYPEKVRDLLEQGGDPGAQQQLVRELFDSQRSIIELAADVEVLALPLLFDALIAAVRPGGQGGDAADPQCIKRALGIGRQVEAARLALRNNANPRLLVESLMCECRQIYREFQPSGVR